MKNPTTPQTQENGTGSEGTRGLPEFCAK